MTTTTEDRLAAMEQSQLVILKALDRLLASRDAEDETAVEEPKPKKKKPTQYGTPSVSRGEVANGGRPNHIIVHPPDVYDNPKDDVLEFRYSPDDDTADEQVQQPADRKEIGNPPPKTGAVWKVMPHFGNSPNDLKVFKPWKRSDLPITTIRWALFVNGVPVIDTPFSPIREADKGGTPRTIENKWLVAKKGKPILDALSAAEIAALGLSRTEGGSGYSFMPGLAGRNIETWYAKGILKPAAK